MSLDDLHYHGHPGGRPRWHFHDIKAEPVVIPSGKHDAAILRHLAHGSSTTRELAVVLGMKLPASASRHIHRLELGGYLSRSGNDGVNERQNRLTAYGARALDAM